MRCTQIFNQFLVLSCTFGSAKAFSLSSPTKLSKQSNVALGSSAVEAVSNAVLGTPATAFDDGICPFEITTPIYYVNDKPHIGHAYTSTACDVIARFMRLSGREVFFLSGTDEHGQKVEQSAEKKGVDPQDFVDEVSKSFRELLDLMNISNDKFIRTTSQEHKESVQHLWKTLVDKGFIYKGTYSGWYSVRDECFYNESELVDGKAPTGAEVEWVAKEESYFFKLSEFEDKLLELYESSPDFIAPKSRKNEVVSFVKGGLRDLSVSRTSFKWGVPVPGDEDHVMYVWIDALANYMSALGYPDESPEGNFAKYWPASVHIVGKDILRFHTVYWPAFLMAAGLPVPKRIFAHGWWTKDGEKISKSLGNVIDPVDLVEKYGVDPTRFFLMSEVPFGNDGDYSDSSMVYKCNANLSNELGNICQRVCTLAYKNCDNAVPQPGDLTSEDESLLNSAKALREKAAEAIANQAISQYSQAMVTMVKEANKYIDVMAPWKLNKEDPRRMKTVLYVLLEVIRYSAILYQPLIPDSANKILDQITVPKDERTFAHLESSPVQPLTPMQPPVSVFPRFEIPGEANTAGKTEKPKPKKVAQPQVNREIDISQLDIRVGVITKAWAHEEADKLICEEIDIGEESGPRQIASGLRDFYNAEDLEGQRVLVLSNLKSRKLVGFPSHGMVLCASNGEMTEFVEPPADAAIGERISTEGFSGEPASENQVGKKKMLDKIFPDLKTDDDGVATFKGVPLVTSVGPCRAQRGMAGAEVA
ncbi:unnamed protein product [Cylindrotheca closterium]|uniref:methionine--tRNA ligase n=1 Tax=Cylindrotheca closterium TaxID=2856 RepID=A0AAD2CMQ5_9STRA|nr:unnamed protein product [Cylindrotheca closterium]